MCSEKVQVGRKLVKRFYLMAFCMAEEDCLNVKGENESDDNK